MKKILITLLMASLMSVTAAAWGKLGHATIVKIAENHLTKKARENIDRYFAYDLADDASWMDRHRNDEGLEFTTYWHVYPVMESGHYDPSPRMKYGDCIRALHYCDANLRIYKELPDSAVVMSVRMLIHFVGDMHCPSHAYFLGKRNFWNCSLDTLWQGTFHGFYDRLPMFIYQDKTPEQVAEILDYNTRNSDLVKAAEGSFEDWAYERAKADMLIYELNEPGTEELDPETVWKSSALANEAMRLAGLRLASLLNRYFGK